MSSTPTIFPSGINTYPPQHVLADYPMLPTPWQIVKNDDFIPFRSGDYTATSSGTGAAQAAFAWNGGVLRITSGSTSTFKSLLALATPCMQVLPGNKIWYEMRAGMPTGSMTNPTNDADFYTGLFNNVDPSAATDGIYFFKPNGGTAVHFIVKKGSTTTTFQNVADFAKPSGAFGDPSDVAGLLTANATGTTLTSLVVTTAGFGYRVAPLIIVNGTAGSGAAAAVQLGGSAGFPTVGAAFAGSSLYSPIINAAGSGYTAGTFTIDIIPWVNLQFYYNGKGQLQVAVGGRVVLSLDRNAQTTIAPGATVNTATGAKSYNFATTSLTAGVMPVQPPVGDPIVAMPLVSLAPAFGLVGTGANNRVAYIEEINFALELN